MKKTIDELLEIDFSKYKKILINSVIVYPSKIVVLKDNDGIQITGYKSDEEIFFTHYSNETNISITRNEDASLIAIRRDVRA